MLFVAIMATPSYMNAQELKTFLEDVTMDLHVGFAGSAYHNAPISSKEGGGGLVGVNVGVRASKPFLDINDKTYLYGGLGIDYTPKGGELAYNHEAIGSSMLHANYIEIPIHAGINRRITRGISLFAEVGTYMAYGVAGESEAPDHYDGKIKTFEEVLNPFDAGILLRYGSNFGKSFRLEIGGNLGLINASKENALSKVMLRSDKVYMTTFYFTLSWKISGQRKNTGVRK